jgi:hypothetical protein
MLTVRLTIGLRVIVYIRIAVKTELYPYSYAHSTTYHPDQDHCVH